MNSLGETIYTSGIVADNEINIDGRRFADGVYYIQIIDTQNQIHEIIKLIKIGNAYR